MKKITLALTALFILSLIHAETWIYDKNHPEYNQHDWRADYWGYVYNGNDGEGTIFTMHSPFYVFDETNLDFLAEGPESDFQPSDGWELLYANLGDREADFGENEVKVLLYNKERGIIRFFFRKLETGDHTRAYAQIRASSNSGILSTITGEGEHIYALDQRINVTIPKQL
ncbi:MAG: hypothetical protein CSB55_04565 [Candidatus Cloacimonadota bacterium]|nr:MAG: hypothetical protein CSB55_04565 [Candidatus Cloacimonadota bacterium]